MATEEYREVVGIISHKGNLDGLRVSIVLEAYCRIEGITTNEFNYSHLEGLQEYPKYKALASNCGPLNFGRIKKELGKLVEKKEDDADMAEITKKIIKEL